MLLATLSVQAQTPKSFTIDFSKNAIDANGYYIYKFPLQYNALPSINITEAQLDTLATKNNTLPFANSYDPDIAVGVAQKKPYAILRFPAYIIKNQQRGLLKSISFDVIETEQTPSRQRPNFVENSILASGTWYKIAIKERGIYKIDHAFLSSLGLNPAQVNPQNLRIYGNGGKLMSEKAGSTDNYDDLLENAVFVNTANTSFGINDYILFYADGPTTWQYNHSQQLFQHTTNIYDEYSYYFINTDIGPSKKIRTSPTPVATPVTTINDFDAYQLYENDSFSASELGRVWWSNRMSTNNSPSLTQNINFNLYLPIGPVYYETVVGHKNTNAGLITLSINGNVVNNANLPLVNVAVYDYYTDRKLNGNVPVNSSTINFQYRYSSSSTGIGFIDYLAINYKSQLQFTGGQLNFRNASTTTLGINNFARYQIANGANTTVWEVTDPFNITIKSTNTANGNLSFLAEGNMLREFIAFDGTNFRQPIALGTVENQNLHALDYHDLIIITHPDLLDAAQNFAAYKTNNFGQSVIVTTTDKIYNEFSSGGQDIAGIRNFIKMFYDRATTPDQIPQGVLLYGNASYDFKNRILNNTNFVPGYQSKASSSNRFAYMTDDYYAILDDGEELTDNNSFNTHMLDLPIGRLPINNTAEAAILLEKYKNYHSSASYGPWKNDVTYVADDKDAGPGGDWMNHLNDCEVASEYFTNQNPSFNVYKIYADAFSRQITSAGARFPGVNKAINDKIMNGTLFMSYSGHGSPARWAHEAILTVSDYSRWNNSNRLPLIFTGTCDFSRFDNPSISAAGVELLKRKDGGAIALISTTQIVYQGANRNLSQSMANSLFTPNNNGKYRTLGEALRISKNENANDIANNLNFALLGDPTMKLQIPELKIITDEIYNISTEEEIPTDTLQSLGKYSIEGHIADFNNTPLQNFNGVVYISIFDKPINLQTIPGPNNIPTPQFPIQNNILAKIKASVVNGRFKASFLIPKDIIFDYGKGKISLYAHSDNQEAQGVDTNFHIGGIDPNASENDNTGPIVKAYIDSDKFKDGSIVGANPQLYATFFDDNGINVSGSSLGHDLVAILNDDESNPFVMNMYYNTELNDYRRGYVYFPFYNLPEGKHSIKVRAWDVHNNSGEGIVNFEVKNPNKGFIGEVYNYPNPFTQSTNIVIQHNQEGKNLNVTIRIYNTSGALIGYTQKDILAEGNRTTVTWDGTTLDGRPLEAGLYFYNVAILTEDGKSAAINQKLVYLPQ